MPVSRRRLTSDVRRAAILQAAAEVFFEQGYAETGIDAIIRRVGGSKRNIYDEFGSKDGLFIALVAEHADKALAPLSWESAGGNDVRAALLQFGYGLTEILLSPALLGVYRAIITEAKRFPKLAEDFYDKGPGRAAARLAEFLQAAQAHGEICVSDPFQAADHFVGMIRDNLHLKVVLGLRPPPTQKEVEVTVISAVDIFLNGIRSTSTKRGLKISGSKQTKKQLRRTKLPHTAGSSRSRRDHQDG
jgi:AcrR family transcriptional regulator